MEYRDLYNEAKELTGKRILKGETVPLGYYYITVVVFIENSNNELLLQINNKYNLWSFTGGHPKSGESSLEGIVAEVKEELNLDILEDELELFHIIKTDDDFVDLYYLKKDIDINSIVMQKEEVSAVRWFNSNELDNIIISGKMLPSHEQFYNLYKNKKAQAFFE